MLGPKATRRSAAFDPAAEQDSDRITEDPRRRAAPPGVHQGHAHAGDVPHERGHAVGDTDREHDAGCRGPHPVALVGLGVGNPPDPHAVDL